MAVIVGTGLRNSSPYYDGTGVFPKMKMKRDEDSITSVRAHKRATDEVLVLFLYVTHPTHKSILQLVFSIFRGVSYGDRTSIPQNLVLNPCTQACRCRVPAGGEPKFDCAAVDCFDTFDGDIEKQCIKTYELDSCCSTATVCGKDRILPMIKEQNWAF